MAPVQSVAVSPPAGLTVDRPPSASVLLDSIDQRFYRRIAIDKRIAEEKIAAIESQASTTTSADVLSPTQTPTISSGSSTRAAASPTSRVNDDAIDSDLYHPDYPPIEPIDGHPSADPFSALSTAEERSFATGMHRELTEVRQDITKYRRNVRIMKEESTYLRKILWGDEHATPAPDLNATIPEMRATIVKHSLCSPTKKIIARIRAGDNYTYPSQRDAMRAFIESTYKFIFAFCNAREHLQLLAPAIGRAQSHKRRILKGLANVNRVVVARRQTNDVDFLQIMVEREARHLADVFQPAEDGLDEHTTVYTRCYAPAATKWITLVVEVIADFNNVFETYWTSEENPTGIDRMDGGDVKRVMRMRARDVHRALTALGEAMRVGPPPAARGGGKSTVSKKRKAEDEAVGQPARKKSPCSSRMQTLEELVNTSLEMQEGGIVEQKMRQKELILVFK
ncbi:hypothetical protein DRE_00206 [Drechslerella stenobrocha 248]|uniref:Uncharacterized protein n=1 Tax=Drechslerella stenobrocha 248 TaxID=1043628 RepID=W7HXG7_9PEZI|nr:hypothetical protein DRE_00206 [Drechslerella stenobrocha 248]